MHINAISMSTTEAMTRFIEEFVREGCHHGCTEDSCSQVGKQRMAKAKAILFDIERDLSQAEKENA